ncbi:MAG: hypothetical protein C5B51_29965 [Terriglobia bacterium]|nr:MAG: hypothetical protein C5B51_29965 [Terriglobia bacterium]
MVLAPEATQAQLERILQNKNLRLSEVQRRLLTYLAERSLSGATDDLKEYTIGVDAFGKPPSYDPRQESMVRMHVARLRQKLAEYYRTDGSDDPILVELPKGGFKVVFEPRPVPAELPEKPAPAVTPGKPRFRLRTAAAALLVAGIAGGLYFIAGSSRTGASADPLSGWSPDLQQLWAPILSAGRPLVVCIATPSFGTASGAFRLGQFLGARKPDLLVTPSTQLSMPEIAMDNVVFLGPATGNRQIQAVPIDQQIVLEPGGIRNLNPRPGEPSFLSDQVHQGSQELEESHALITHTPGLYGKGEILYLSGNQVSSVMAAVQAFTDPILARTLVSKMRTTAGTMPRYYQTVLRVKSMDDMPIEISYMFHRELPPAKVANPKP